MKIMIKTHSIPFCDMCGAKIERPESFPTLAFDTTDIEKGENNTILRLDLCRHCAVDFSLHIRNYFKFIDPISRKLYEICPADRTASSWEDQNEENQV